MINWLGCIEGVTICSETIFFFISFKISAENYTLGHSWKNMQFLDFIRVQIFC